MKPSRLLASCVVVFSLVLPCVAQQQPGSADKISALSAELEKDPNDRAKVVELGNAYFDSKDWALAEKWYTKALEIDDQDANVLTDLGTVQRNLGQFEEALASFEKALVVDPNHWQTLYNKCLVLIFDLGRASEAGPVLDALGALRNDHPEIPDLTKMKAAVGDSQPVEGPGFSPELEQAARRFVAYQIPEDYLDELYQQGAKASAVAIENSVQPTIGRAVTESERSRLFILCYNFMKEAMPLSVMQDVLWPVIAKHFSLDDLRAINAFLGTPTGQKLIAAQAEIMRESETAGEQLGQRLASQESGQRLRAELKRQFPDWYPEQPAP